MVTLLYTFLMICLSGSALAQIPRDGTCPNVQSQPDFDTYRFAGDWYEVSRSFVMFELRSKCNVINWNPTSNYTGILTNTHTSGFTGRTRSFAMKYKLNPQHPAETETSLPLTPFDAVGRLRTKCWVLETDYDNYAIGYCCTNYNAANLQAIWIMSRTPTAQSHIAARAHDVLQKNNIDFKLIWRTEQKKCPSRESV